MRAVVQTEASRLDPLIIAGENDALADGLLLPQAPDASALARPGMVDKLWVEREYTELEAEQDPAWAAAGREAARVAQVSAAGQQLAAASARSVVEGDLLVLQAAREFLLDAQVALAPYRRRGYGSKIWYQLAKAGFVLGDLAGFASAAIWLGEEIPLAITLAVSAATATVAAGFIGAEVKDVRGREQRARPLEELNERECRFPNLFTRPTSGGRVLGWVAKISAGTAGMIGLGIGTLRAVVDDPLVGIVFGGIALAVAGGSFLVSYAGADEVADLIDQTEHDYKKAYTRHLALASSPVWRQHARSLAEAESLLAEHELRGRAAGDHLRALKWRVLRQNPHVAGHGTAASSVGRITRTEGS